MELERFHAESCGCCAVSAGIRGVSAGPVVWFLISMKAILCCAASSADTAPACTSVNDILIAHKACQPSGYRFSLDASFPTKLPEIRMPGAEREDIIEPNHVPLEGTVGQAMTGTPATVSGPNVSPKHTRIQRQLLHEFGGLRAFEYMVGFGQAFGFEAGWQCELANTRTVPVFGCSKRITMSDSETCQPWTSSPSKTNVCNIPHSCLQRFHRAPVGIHPVPPAAAAASLWRYPGLNTGACSPRSCY